MVDMGTFDFHSYDAMSIEQLADIRDQGLKRVDTVTNVMREQVKQAHADGTPILKLAKRAGVTRPTIYSWLGE
jgi:AcrR family transcriptional regulator